MDEPVRPAPAAAQPMRPGRPPQDPGSSTAAVAVHRPAAATGPAASPPRSPPVCRPACGRSHPGAVVLFGRRLDLLAARARAVHRRPDPRLPPRHPGRADGPHRPAALGLGADRLRRGRVVLILALRAVVRPLIDEISTFIREFPAFIAQVDRPVRPPRPPARPPGADRRLARRPRQRRRRARHRATSCPSSPGSQASSDRSSATSFFRSGSST